MNLLAFFENATETAPGFWEKVWDFLQVEGLGLLASAFILVSFLFSKQVITRLINFVGCIIFVIYALLFLPTPSYSTAFMNAALAIVHIVFLTKDFIAKKKAKSSVDGVQNAEQTTDGEQPSTESDTEQPVAQQTDSTNN